MTQTRTADNVRINVRCTPEERDALDQAAADAGMDRSAFVRHRLGMSNGPDPVDVVKMTNDGAGWPVMKFRVQPELLPLVERATAVSVVTSTASFCREAIEAAAHRELAEHKAAAERATVPVQPARPLRWSTDCVHPPSARVTPAPGMSPYCRLCGSVLSTR